MPSPDLGSNPPEIESESSYSGPSFDRGSDGLIPAIAQDATSKQILMVAWMNTEAFEETVATGFATYYSRSRKRLWRKGEESGHRQEVVGIYLDCDKDTILLHVNQIGAACHEGYASCFFRKFEQGKLIVIAERLIDPKDIY